MILQEIFQNIVLILFFVSAAVLIFLILIQSGKGGGMGMLGGGGSNTAFGSSTVDIVEKITWWGATAFFILAILAAIAFADTGPALPEKETAVEAMDGASGNAETPVPENAPLENGAEQAPAGGGNAPPVQAQ